MIGKTKALLAAVAVFAVMYFAIAVGFVLAYTFLPIVLRLGWPFFLWALHKEMAICPVAGMLLVSAYVYRLKSQLLMMEGDY